MAQAGLLLDRDQFNCSVCLDVLKDPVTIPCGHSYCSACIKGYWDQDDYLAIYACPQCRQTFNPRPPLHRNTMLTDVVEKFKNTRLQAAPTPESQTLAGPEDVECDVCIGKKSPAVKSCLVCLASYCETHLKPHYESAAFKKHKLVPPSKKLQDAICPQHDKLLEVYCRTDKTCICYLCLTDEHKGHDTVLAEAEIQEKKTHLSAIQQNSQQRIQEREREVDELKQAILFLNRSARITMEESDKVFTELIRTMELKRFEVRELIRVQEKAAVTQAEMVMEKLQKEIAELKRRGDELEQLVRMDDHILFLQSCQSVEAPPKMASLPSVTIDSSITFGPVASAVFDFKSLLNEVCQGGFVCIFEKVRDVAIIPSSKPSVQLEMEEPKPQSSVCMEGPVAAPALASGPEQNPVNPLNPFLAQGPSVPVFGGFVLSPLGSKLSSSSSRQMRQMQRRPHPRRK